MQGDIDIGISRSTDKGQSWEPMRIAQNMGEWGGLPEKFNGVSDACLLADPKSGDVYLAGLWMHGVINAEGKWVEGLTEDDGITWSEPVKITKSGKKEEWWLYAPEPDHGITMEDGTFVFPTQRRDESGGTFSNITYSRDNGKTWKSPNAAYTNTTESMVVQLEDGSLMQNMRDNRNRQNKSETNGRAIAFTNDMGVTWQEHSTSHGALIESVCMASIHKHIYTENGQKKSMLLFSNPNSKHSRIRQTIKVSFDTGETWPEDN